MSNRVEDHYGRQIKKNAVITYPVRQGSNMWLQTGKVNEVRNDGSLSVTSVDTGRSTVVKNTDMTIIANKDITSAVNAQIRSLA